MMEGTQIPAFINIPAALLVFGGTLGVTMAGTSMEQIKLVPKLYKLAFSPPEQNIRQRVTLLVRFAEMARKEGLLALDDELQSVEDEFTRKGMQLVVDGTRSSSARSSRSSSRRWPGATPRAHSRSRRPAVSPRPWASPAR
jgi:chemotaxis protein MotA